MQICKVLTLLFAMVAVVVGAQNCFAQAAPPAQQTTREAFLAMIDRPRVDPAAEVTPLPAVGGLVEYHFTFFSEKSEKIPGILLAKPEVFKDGARHPAAIVLHGTGGKKEAEMDSLKLIADKGMIAVAIDARYHGERGTPAQYNAAIATAYADGKSHPLYYDEVWDQMRLIDYLQTRSDIDPNKIGMMGISKGGIEVWLTAAVDPRVAVAIPCISVQSFDWGLHNDRWHNRVGTVQAGFTAAAKGEGIDKPDAAFTQKFYDRLIPGIYTKYDCPQMLPLIAPRPLLVISGDKDPINPIEGLRLSETSTKAAYAAAGAADKFSVILQANTGHAVPKKSKEAAVDWFAKWMLAEKQ